MGAPKTDFDLPTQAVTKSPELDDDFDIPAFVVRAAYFGVMVALISWFIYIVVCYRTPVHRESSTAGKAVVNQLGTVVAWDKQAAETTGIKEQQMLGKDIWSIAPVGQRNQFRKQFELSVENDGLYKFPEMKMTGLRLKFDRVADSQIQVVFLRP